MFYIILILLTSSCSSLNKQKNNYQPSLKKSLNNPVFYSGKFILYPSDQVTFFSLNERKTSHCFKIFLTWDFINKINQMTKYSYNEFVEEEYKNFLHYKNNLESIFLFKEKDINLSFSQCSSLKNHLHKNFGYSD